MAKLIALYGKPTDAAAFDAYYEPVHTPIARGIPGLRALTFSKGPVMTPQGPSDYHKVGVLQVDTMADLQAALASPQGQAAAADLANFATGGVTLLVFDE